MRNAAECSSLKEENSTIRTLTDRVIKRAGFLKQGEGGSTVQK
jgi:hypothetical protein